MKNNSWLAENWFKLGLLICAVIAIVVFFQTFSTKKSDSVTFGKSVTTTSTPPAKVEAVEKSDPNTIPVERIPYIGCNGTTCIIPKASGLPADEDLYCVWNWAAGSGAIPYTELTRGWLPQIEDPGSGRSELSVLCRDTNGKVYFGLEGEERSL